MSDLGYLRQPSIGGGTIVFVCDDDLWSVDADGGAARRLSADVREFCRQAKILLTEEKLAAQTGNLTKLGKVNERVDVLRNTLFGARMNHGGLCRQIFDSFDHLLLQLLQVIFAGV